AGAPGRGDGQAAGAELRGRRRGHPRGRGASARAGRGGGVRRLRHLQVSRSREAGARDRAGHHALRGRAGGGGCLARAGRGDARAGDRRDRARGAAAGARMVKAGVLALQGDYDAHAAVLRAQGAEVSEVRRPEALRGLHGLVVPGGESTALLRLMDGAPWAEEIGALHARGGALFGTCAGAILLARAVRPAQKSLGLLDVEIERNGYGRQVDSFEADVQAAPPYGPLRGTFIRAPRIRAVGPAVEVLGTLRGEPVLVREGRVLAATFHPELEGANGVHRDFLRLAAGEKLDTPDDGYEISTDPARL